MGNLVFCKNNYDHVFGCTLCSVKFLNFLLNFSKVQCYKNEFVNNKIIHNFAHSCANIPLDPLFFIKLKQSLHKLWKWLSNFSQATFLWEKISDHTLCINSISIVKNNYIQFEIFINSKINKKRIHKEMKKVQTNNTFV